MRRIKNCLTSFVQQHGLVQARPCSSTANFLERLGDLINDVDLSSPSACCIKGRVTWYVSTRQDGEGFPMRVKISFFVAAAACTALD